MRTRLFLCIERWFCILSQQFQFSITICQHRDSDSWALFELGEKRILNLNDCFVYEANELYNIKKYCGKIDILLTQFSFANWIGNIGDKVKSKSIAKWHLKKFKNQIIDHKRINEILKNIKNKSIKSRIDTKTTSRIWKSIIWSYVDYQKRNFRKK